ncbi:hypothetical protein TNIN_300861 [Trichonephila inaurata madagascariensis]|uniref:Peptidase S8 pro-domain domain-containing protein n=1 Tax=Trichonephila inaurata madagascariensis TaxID=2747483 RepID=A0A8X6YR05_9ARAC|nr:hypothetical protein TNIN_300861 [Trichonephila inaurata madagascariensis]
MYKLCIILLMFELLQSVQHVEAIHTNEFAVHIQGGEDKAKELAKKYGFVNRGQIQLTGIIDAIENPIRAKHIQEHSYQKI